MFSLALLPVLIYFSAVTTSLGDERAVLYFSRAWCHGLPTTCDCGTP